MNWWDTIKSTVGGALGYVADSYRNLGQNLVQSQKGYFDSVVPPASAATTAPKIAVKPTPTPAPAASVVPKVGGSAAVVPAAAAPAPAPSLTPQHVAINGALYNTAEKQAAAFSDIRVVGTPGQPGAYLAGVPKTTPTISLPGGTYSAGPTGDVTPGGETINVPDTVTGGTAGGETGSGVTAADAIKSAAAGGASSDTIAAFLKTVQDQNAEYSRLIAGTLTPSTREQELQKQIDELTGGFKQGKANIEGRPIPLEDIAGQEQQLLQNTEAILSPLTAELTRAQNLRTNTGQMLTTLHGVEAQNNATQWQAIALQQQAATQATTQTRQFAFDMMKNYPDAGITSSDTAQQIATKVAGSDMYKAQLAEAQSKANASKVLGTMSKDEFDRTMAISKEAHGDKDVILFGQIRDSFNAMLSANAQVKANPAAGGVADLTMLRAYAKMTDPGGRITDGEFETMGDATGALAKLGIKWTTGMIQGDRLTQAGRDFFVQQGQMTYDNYYGNYTKAVDYYKKLATDSGVDPNRVIPLITANTSQVGTTTGGDAAMADTFKEITGEEVPTGPIKDEVGGSDQPKSWWDAAVDWFTGKKVSAAPPKTINALANSIGQFESGGRYNAVGPETKYGRAYGKYQVLASNVPAWTKEALGTAMSPREFLADTAAQDAVARYKMAQYFKQFNGDLNKVTIAWFAGPGNASKRSVVDQATGVNGHTYLARVRSIFDGMVA